MVAPDLRGCPVHGPAEWVLYQYAGNRTEQRCLACRRERTSRNHNWTDRCYRGHLKTPWTWRVYGPRKFGRCLVCQGERRRARRAA